MNAPPFKWTRRRYPPWTMRGWPRSGQDVGRCRRIWRFHFNDANGNLDEAQTQGVELGGSDARTHGHGGAQPPHRPVRSGVQEEAKLVGGLLVLHKVRSAARWDLGFDVVLGIPASTVAFLYERLRLPLRVFGDDERVVSTLRADLDGGDDALGFCSNWRLRRELLELPFEIPLLMTVRAPVCHVGRRPQPGYPGGVTNA